MHLTTPSKVALQMKAAAWRQTYDMAGHGSTSCVFRFHVRTRVGNREGLMGCDTQFDRGDESEFEERKRRIDRKQDQLWEKLDPVPLGKLTVSDLRDLVAVLTPSQYHTWNEDDNEVLQNILNSAGD